jgi:hypothetical protein
MTRPAVIGLWLAGAALLVVFAVLEIAYGEVTVQERGSPNSNSVG